MFQSKCLRVRDPSCPGREGSTVSPALQTHLPATLPRLPCPALPRRQEVRVARTDRRRGMRASGLSTQNNKPLFWRGPELSENACYYLPRPAGNLSPPQRDPQLLQGRKERERTLFPRGKAFIPERWKSGLGENYIRHPRISVY